jgi:hypothetical protein
MKSQNQSIQNPLVIFGIFAIAITTILCTIDEGFYNFNWMLDLVNWIMFLVYSIVFFIIQFGLYFLINKLKMLQNKSILSVLVGFVILFSILILIFK